MILSVAEPVSSFEAMGAGLRGFRAEVAEFDPARKLEQARARWRSGSENKSDSDSLAGESPLKRLKACRQQRSSGKPGNGEPT
jgi:hypothetical protein